MANAKPAAIEMSLSEAMEMFEGHRAEDAAWKTANQAQMRALDARLRAMSPAAVVNGAQSWVTKDDVIYAGGGAALGTGVAYLGTTQGWWALSPLNIGIGLGSGAVAGYAVGRVFRKK